jgi:hypothetical protein
MQSVINNPKPLLLLLLSLLLSLSSSSSPADSASLLLPPPPPLLLLLLLFVTSPSLAGSRQALPLTAPLRCATHVCQAPVASLQRPAVPLLLLLQL